MRILHARRPLFRKNFLDISRYSDLTFGHFLGRLYPVRTALGLTQFAMKRIQVLNN